jgi:DNA-binding transcriptional LysR family regulator
VSPELRQLRYFVAVADELNFTRAARRVFVVQQALSQAIAQLEEQLGTRLFVRTTHSVALTEAGETLLPFARETLAAADRGVIAMNAAVAGASGRICVGLAATAGLDVTPTLLRRFRECYPDVAIEVRHHEFDDPHAGLLAHETDVGIVRRPLSDDQLTMIELGVELRYAALSTMHPLAAETTVELEQLLDEPWVRMNAEGVWADAWIAADRRSPESSSGPMCRTLDDLLEAARSLLGISLVPESVVVARDWPGLRFVRVADLPPSPVALAWRSDDSRVKVKNFVDLAREVRSERDGELRDLALAKPA